MKAHGESADKSSFYNSKSLYLFVLIFDFMEIDMGESIAGNQNLPKDPIFQKFTFFTLTNK